LPTSAYQKQHATLTKTLERQSLTDVATVTCILMAIFWLGFIFSVFSKTKAKDFNVFPGA
jgi:uncharacterized membrane protein